MPLQSRAGTATADLVDVAFDRQAVKLLDRQRHKKLDAIFERDIRLAESFPLLSVRVLHGSRVRHAPMGGDRIARPDRADFTGGLVADRKDKIHDRRAGPGELVPAFAAQAACRQMKLFEQVESYGMNRAFRKAAGAIAFEPFLAPMLDQHFGDDAPGLVAGAEKEDVVRSFIHPRLAPPRAGLRASTVAEATKFSMPRPGAQLATSSRLSGFGVTRTSVKPACTSQVSIRSTGAAPAMQPHKRAGSACSSSDSGVVLTTSEIASRPPGFSTRNASRNTCALSGTRLITQWDRMASALLSATGRCSSSPRRNSTLATPILAAFSRAFFSISWVMSIPITRPLAPTCAAARKQSKPAPLPRSITTSPGFRAAIACGLPQPSPRLAPSGTAASSASE